MDSNLTVYPSGVQRSRWRLDFYLKKTYHVLYYAILAIVVVCFAFSAYHYNANEQSKSDSTLLGLMIVLIVIVPMFVASLIGNHIFQITVFSIPKKYISFPSKSSVRDTFFLAINEKEIGDVKLPFAYNVIQTDRTTWDTVKQLPDDALVNFVYAKDEGESLMLRLYLTNDGFYEHQNISAKKNNISLNSINNNDDVIKKIKLTKTVDDKIVLPDFILGCGNHSHSRDFEYSNQLLKQFEE